MKSISCVGSIKEDIDMYQKQNIDSQVLEETIERLEDCGSVISYAYKLGPNCSPAYNYRD